LGAPDCGHSSVLAYSRAKKLSNIKDNDSFKVFVEAVSKYNPKMFFMENLTALFKNLSLKDFESLFPGYKIKMFESSVANFGNSQITRVRLFIFGVRKDLRNSKAILKKIRKPELDKTQLLKVKDLAPTCNYPDISLGHVREPEDSLITIYAGKKLPYAEIKRLWLEDFKGLSRFPVNDRKFTNAPGVYRNLPNKYPATARKQNRQYNPEGDMMTPRELANIQGIPLSFNIYMEEDRLGYWINKGRITVTKCPPYEIGVWLKKLIVKLNKTQLL
jgi:site-specific DNA-cytosine methylase